MSPPESLRFCPQTSCCPWHGSQAAGSAGREGGSSPCSSSPLAVGERLVCVVGAEGDWCDLNRSFFDVSSVLMCAHVCVHACAWGGAYCVD